MIKIFTDAATQPQAEISGGGLLIIQDGQQTQLSFPLTEKDNHTAELAIIIKALDYLIDHQLCQENIILYSDSKTAIKILDQKRVKNNLFQPYLSQFNDLVENFSLFILQWIPESQNKGADRLARQALQKQLKNRRK